MQRLRTTNRGNWVEHQLILAKIPMLIASGDGQNNQQEWVRLNGNQIGASY